MGYAMSKPYLRAQLEADLCKSVCAIFVVCNANATVFKVLIYFLMQLTLLLCYFFLVVFFVAVVN